MKNEKKSKYALTKWNKKSYYVLSLRYAKKQILLQQKNQTKYFSVVMINKKKRNTII
jgi:hypothetical protein